MTITFYLLLFRHEKPASLKSSSPIVAGATEAPSCSQINFVGQESNKPANQTIVWEELPKSTTVKCSTDSSIIWVELPKVTPEVMINIPQASIDVSVPGVATTSGSLTILETNDNRKPELEAGSENLLSVCRTDGGMFEFTATDRQTDEYLPISGSTLEKPSKKDEKVNNEGVLYPKGNAGSETVAKNSCYSSGPFMHSGKHDIDYKQSTLLETCPTVSKIFGMPSRVTVKGAHCLTDERPFGEKLFRTKNVLRLYVSQEDEKKMKERIRLVPSCPREARCQGFPSAQQSSFIYNGTNMVEFSFSCPRISNIPGLPSVCETVCVPWFYHDEPILDKHVRIELLLGVSPRRKGEIKSVGGLLTSCPKQSRIQGLPSIIQPNVGHYESNTKIISSSHSERSHCEEVQSSNRILSKELATDWKHLGQQSKVDIVVNENRIYSNDMNAIAAPASVCPKETCISGLSYTTEPSISNDRFSNINLISTCPATTSIAGFPSKRKTEGNEWNTIHGLLRERETKEKPLLLLNTNDVEKDIQGNTSLVFSCPRLSAIFGIPSYLVQNPSMNMNMVSLSNTCSKVSWIPGFPSASYSEELTMSKETLFEPRMREKQVPLIDRHEEQTRESNVFLVPSCPKEAKALGFPSYLNPLSVHNVANTSLLTLSTQVSKIPGFSTIGGNITVEWVTEKWTLMKRPRKEFLILDSIKTNTKLMNNMFSCIPSCPKKSSIPGFPSFSNQKSLFCSLNVVNLLPLCPRFTLIPGFSSVVGHNEKGLVVEQGPFILRPQKKILFMIYSAPITSDKPNNMHALAPSCPRASRIPGFPSTPQHNMLNLAPVCPKESSLPGFATIEKASNFQWIFKPLAFCHKPLKKEFVIFNNNYNSNKDRETAKKMLDFRPSCPEASKIFGFPFAPLSKSKIKFNMISFTPCCSCASSIKGFGSITTSQSTEWPNKAKPVLLKPQRKTAVMSLPSLQQYQLDCCKMKSMVAFAVSCPKEARVYGCSSAPVVNRPPNMITLSTTAPCVSCVPGFPSKMPSVEYIHMETTTDNKILFKKQVQDEKVVLFQTKHQHSEEDIKSMVAMAPSCPCLTRIPGFPSTPRLNSAEKDAITFPPTCSTERYTSQELSTSQSMELYFEDTNLSIFSTPLNRLSTPPINGETSTVLRLWLIPF